MDDVLPARARAASFAYLLAFAVTAALVLAWDGYPSPAGRMLGPALAPAAVAPLIAAMRGASLGVSYAWTTALAALSLVALAARDGDPSRYDFSSPLSVALAAFMALACGGSLAGFFELFAAPFKARIAGALREGLQRSVPWECLLVQLYCSIALMGVLHEYAFDGRCAHSVLALNALTGAAALVSFAWELRLRLRVRRILAGRVPGWRAVELPDDAPRTAPRLGWLDDFGWLPRPRAARRDRAIVRDDALDAGAYRTAPRTPAPYVIVPPRVPLTCARSAICVAWGLSLAHVTAAFVEMRREFAPGAPVAETDAAIDAPDRPPVRAPSAEASPQGLPACMPSGELPASFAGPTTAPGRPEGVNRQGARGARDRDASRPGAVRGDAPGHGRYLPVTSPPLRSLRPGGSRPLGNQRGATG